MISSDSLNPPSALVVVITAVFASPFVRGSLQWHDVDLLWIGVVAMLLCAACSFALRTRGVELVSAPGHTLDSLRDGHSYLFYAIYAAESLGTSFGDVDDFLVFFGVGLLAGIPLWRLVRRRLGVRGMYACSAGISVAAAIICTQIVVGLGVIFAGFTFSGLADYGLDVWPLGLLLALTALACLAATRAPRTITKV